jgi:uncharacterized protein YjiS (DUF1127 family)
MALRQTMLMLRGKPGAMLTTFLFDTIGRYLRYRSQLASVYELDDRMLLDIGLNRGELRATSWDLVH